MQNLRVRVAEEVVVRVVNFPQAFQVRRTHRLEQSPQAFLRVPERVGHEGRAQLVEHVSSTQHLPRVVHQRLELAHDVVMEDAGVALLVVPLPMLVEGPVRLVLRVQHEAHELTEGDVTSVFPRLRGGVLPVALDDLPPEGLVEVLAVARLELVLVGADQPLEGVPDEDDLEGILHDLSPLLGPEVRQLPQQVRVLAVRVVGGDLEVAGHVDLPRQVDEDSAPVVLRHARDLAEEQAPLPVHHDHGQAVDRDGGHVLLARVQAAAPLVHREHPVSDLLLHRGELGGLLLLDRSK